MATAWLDADWPAPAGVRALTTLRHGLGGSVAPLDHFNLGNRTAADGDDPVTVERNRALLVEHARLPSAPRWLRQVHGVGVARFDDGPSTEACDSERSTCQSERSEESGVGGPSRFLAALGMTTGGFGTTTEGLGMTAEGPRMPVEGFGLMTTGRPVAAEPEADAAVTSTPGNVLAILTADCLPVLLCADDGSEVAAAHAGWRGLAAGVLEATIAAMRTPPERLMAWLGPAAGPQNYEVGVEVYDAFVAPDWAAGSAFVSTRPQHWRVDLYALARRRLTAAGVSPQRIHGGHLCTIADPQRFYSHRRDRRTGRMASLIWIAPD